MFPIITLPNSKSIRIRQLIDRFVKSGEVLEISELDSADVRVTAEALRKIADNTEDKKIVTIDVADCGAAYRFLTALLAVTPGQWLLTGTKRLLQRPIAPLLDTLHTIGAEIFLKEDGLHIEGKLLRAATASIDGTQSSQFVSALLLIAPRLGLHTLQITPPDISSLSYVALTYACANSSVQIRNVACVVKALGDIGDWSAAVFWYAFLLLHHDEGLLLKNLSLDSAQGDAVVADWLRLFGVHSEQTVEGVKISCAHPQSVTATYDASDHLDLVPVMAAIACLTGSDLTFEHIQNLRYKESDRAQALAEELAPFAWIQLSDSTLRVHGKPRTQWPFAPVFVDTRHDHRLAMCFLLFENKVIINDLRCLDKSYPGLLSQWERLVSVL